jgi:hypothetical protein
MGPFIYKGVINSRVSGWTNHHSIVEWEGQTYFFYHTSDLSGGKTNRRCIAADYIHLTADGIIHEVVRTKTGVGQYEGFSKVEAENFSKTKGITKNGTRDSVIYITLKDKDFVVYNNICFGDKLANSIQLRYATENDNAEIEILELKKKGKMGKSLAKIPLESTLGSQNWNTINFKFKPITGNKNIAIKYKAKGGALLNLDWFLLKE